MIAKTQIIKRHPFKFTNMWGDLIVEYKANPMTSGYIVSWDNPEVGKGVRWYSDYSVGYAIRNNIWSVL